MKNQKKTLSLILIITIIIIGILAYFYYLGDNPADNKMIVSSISDEVLIDEELKIPQVGKDLLKTLKVLRVINLDTNFFEQEVFKGLVDNSKELPFEERGRLNPFSPIGI